MQARSARRLLPRPQVVEGELEPGACLWCYCCSEEVERHRTDREVTVAWGGMLEHMGRWVGKGGASVGGAQWALTVVGFGCSSADSKWLRLVWAYNVGLGPF